MTTTGRTFRVFVSSTFSDLKVERNALQERVFPSLRELCEEHSCRFQAIDLRWGVSEEAAIDHKTMAICLSEIARCQETSSRPNFIVLLGDRYGWLPLPAQISGKESAQLLQHLSDHESTLFHAWYRRDDNAIPATYCLQPRSGKYVDYENWEEVEQTLHSALESATRKLNLYPNELLKYTSSATEQEIVDGALRPADALDHVFCYFREIDGLPQDKRARGYIDMDSAGNPIADAPGKLSAIKASLDHQLTNNVHRYSSRWKEDGPTLDHLDQLCEDVYKDLEQVIMAEIALLDESDPLDDEIGAHEEFAEMRALQFTGRTEILAQLSDYLASSNDFPLAVWGESGMGKSALMAKAAHQVKMMFPTGEIIFRSIGATPESSSGRALLRGLCAQVGRIYGDEEGLPSGYSELAKAFPDFLAKANPNHPIFLFIDAVDQLSDLDNARSLDWLPKELPPNVKLVVSSLPGECHLALEEKLPHKNILKLEPMPLNEGEELLDLWLEESKRRLQPDQKQIVLDNFKHSGLPLYLKLVFDEARLWKSYDPLPEPHKDVPGIISQIFARLSAPSDHGEEMLVRTLGYLAAAKNGLSEDELVDVLSLDDEVLADFMRRSPKSPRVSRLPVVVLSRLFYDLKPFLTEVSADQTTLLRFYHRQVEEVVSAEYLGNNEKTKRHQALADYFDQLHVSIRQLEELPWQLTKSKGWKRLSELMGDWLFFEFAWNRDRFDVEQYWAQLEANSQFRMTDVYQPILELHGDKLDFIDSVAHLLDETFHKEESAALRAYLVEKQREEVNPIDLVQALNAKGVSLKNLGDLEGALEVYAEAETITRNLGDRRTLATILGNQANVFRQQKHFDQALAALEEALDASRELSYQEGLKSTLNGLALVNLELQDFEKALHHLDELEKICRQADDRIGIAAALGNKATILSDDAEPEEVIDLRREEAQIYRDLGIRQKLEGSLTSQANLLHRQASSLYMQTAFRADKEGSEKVITLYTEEEKIWNELNRLDRVILAQSERAVVMALLGQREARSLIEEAYTQAVDNNLTEIAEKVQKSMDVVNSMIE